MITIVSVRLYNFVTLIDIKNSYICGMKEIEINNISDLPTAAKEFLETIGDNRIIALYGDMGAGKTTFTTAVCRELGVKDDVCSPTFTIVNEYESANGEPIYHFDFYRIEDKREALDIGLYDYLYSGYLCLMEWPQLIEELLPEETLPVYIKVIDKDRRVVCI